MFIMLLIAFVALLFMGVGLLLAKYPPKNINWFYGYRTRRSKSSQEAWDEAQKFSSRKYFIMGVIYLILGPVAAFWLPANEIVVTLLVTVPTVAIAFGGMILTEMHLAKLFDKDGKRKS